MSKPLWETYFKDWNDAAKLLNDFESNLTWKEYKNKWCLFGGEALLYSGKTKEEIQAFITGFAFGFAVLPDSIHKQIKQLISD